MSDGGKHYISHVTLGTDHRRRSPAHEVDAAVVALVRQQIDEALAGLLVDIKPGYKLMANTAAGALLATVITEIDAPLCTIAVARNSRQGKALWDMLKQPTPIGALATGDPPQAPWCAVRLYPGLSDYPSALEWLGDFERCVAWAWLARGP